MAILPRITVFVTGHRPEKLGGHYLNAASTLREFAALTLLKRQQNEFTTVITGMALGWDQAIAHACVSLGIPFIAAVPFEGQELSWPPLSQIVYRRLLGEACEVVHVCEPGYAAWKMLKRNAWMVEHAEKGIALWDGSNGGTKHCRDYALFKGVPVENVWEEWKSFERDKKAIRFQKGMKG